MYSFVSAFTPHYFLGVNPSNSMMFFYLVFYEISYMMSQEVAMKISDMFELGYDFNNTKHIWIFTGVHLLLSLVGLLFQF